jgi:nucleoside-triphosphatase THEP1
MKLSINTAFHNKTPASKRAYSGGWVALDQSVEQLAEYINAGFAFSAQFEGQYRTSSNFKACDFIAADIDGTMSLNDALADPFISEHATLIYTTPSHGKDGKDRFRIMFETPSTITSAAIWRDALTGLAMRYGADRKATSGAQIFFGSTDCLMFVLGKTLPEAALDELIAEGCLIREAIRRGDPSAAIAGAAVQSRQTVARNLAIRCSDGVGRVLTEIAPGTRVHCPFHMDLHPSAFILESTKGSAGVRCSSCMQTFWIEGAKRPPYNYFAFETETVDLAASLPDPIANRSDTQRDWLFGDPVQIVERSAQVYNQKHLPEIIQARGVALIRSPKGSGKTRLIEKLVQQARLRGESVLLIGHRRTLLRESASRLGLKCYLDDIERHFSSISSPKKALEARRQWSQRRPDYYAVSIDSLAARLPAPRKYDIVIIDECEQVLSHVCSKTIEHPEPILKVLQHYVGTAKTLYMLDADLNTITSGFVRRSRRPLRENGAIDPILQVVNLYRDESRVCEVFESDTDLNSDLLDAARRGKRLFVACNSKRTAEGMADMLTRSVSDIRTLLVTADEKDDPHVLAFLHDVTGEFLKYDVVLASPAIGTGIDITFPNDEQLIDVVYGIFDTRINAHYDVDQQLGRVRNPGAVKVWVSGDQEYFETDTAAIKSELVHTGKAEAAITGFNADGAIVYDEDEPLLNLRADTYAAVRASLNKLRHHFIELKQHNGWTVKVVPASTDDDEPAEKEVGKDIKENWRAQSLLSAAQIDRNRYRELMDQREAGQAIGAAARWEVSRHEIEWFYGQEISEGLVVLDDDGRYREAVERFETLALHRDFGEVEYALAQFWLTSDWRQSFPNKTDWMLDAILIASELVTKDGFDTTVDVSVATLERFISICLDRADSLEIDFKIRLRRNFEKKPVETLNRILEMLGLALVRHRFEKKAGKRTYYYRLVPSLLAKMLSTVQRRKDVKLERSRDDVDQYAVRLARAKKNQQRKKLPAAVIGNLEVGQADGEAVMFEALLAEIDRVERDTRH